MKGALLLVGAGALLSLLIFRNAEPSQILATLETQVVVHSWDVETARARIGPHLLVVDGRNGRRTVVPKGSLWIPLGRWRSQTFPLPEGIEVHAVLVLMEGERAAAARDLAQRVGHDWGFDEVATLKGGIEAWQAAGLPVEGR